MSQRVISLLQPPPTPTPAPRPSTASLTPATTAAPTTTAAPATTAAQTPPANPDPGILSSGSGLAIIVVLASFILVAAVVPLALDSWRASRWRDNVTTWMTTQKLSGEDLRLTLRTVSRPHGTQGLTRSLIAALVIALAGAALIVELLSAADDATTLRNTIVTALLTVLASVAGFYFGAKTAETQSLNAAGSAPAGGQPHPAATIAAVKQLPGTPASVAITGQGLEGAAIVFGGVPSPGVTPRSDTEVTALVPSAQQVSGKEIMVIAVNARGASAPVAYTYP